MAGSKTGVSTGGLDGAANRINAAVSFIDQQERILEGVMDVLRAQWKGSAAKGYEALMLNWLTRMEDIRRALYTLEDNLGQGSRHHKATEQQVHEHINALQNLLAG